MDLRDTEELARELKKKNNKKVSRSRILENRRFPLPTHSETTILRQS